MIRVQDHWSALLGCDPHARSGVVAEMMNTGPTEVTAYWLQLTLAVGIATMGLVLDSGAVVIAAMLVAPLMIPILNLGMGLAIGSPYLVLRSGARIFASVLLGIGAAASIVRVLPFQTMTAELSARTLPTALDLVTAAFCAFAGVYAAMRPSSDVASTAAGTSIGISLVPPLCTCGYGLGTMDFDVAAGAGLLFVTNLVAIVVVGTLAFAILGFTRVDVRALEAEVLEREGGAAAIPRLARRFARMFASRGGTSLRLAMPIVLLGAVFLPLRAALDEVTWQIRVRQGVDALIRDLGPEVLDSDVRLERRAVQVAVVLIGTTQDAEEVRAGLDRDVSALSGAAPRLAVYAVPDASAFAGLQDALRTRPPVAPPAPAPAPVPVPVPPPAPEERIDDALALVEDAVREHWPVSALGEVLTVRLERGADGFRSSVVHHGSAVDEAASELLDSILAAQLGVAMSVDSRVIPQEPLSPSADLVTFTLDLSVWTARAREIETMWLCVEAPPEPELRRREKPDPGRAILLRHVHDFPRSRVDEAEGWRVRFVRGGCDASANETQTPQSPTPD